MNKNVNTWIEGNGTVRTVFRKMSLWEYASPASCKLQLLKAIEKENSEPSSYLLQYAIERRKKEIQWVSLFLPLFPIVSVLLFFLYGAWISHTVLHLNIGVGLLLILGILYRITCYRQYLEACKFIYYAGDSILQEAAAKKTPKELNPIEIVDFVSPHTILEEGEPAMVMPPVAEETIIAEPLVPEMHKAEEEPLVIPVPENEMTIIPEAPEIPNKGSINTILLHELIKQECGQPNIFRGDIHKNVTYYSYITGCKPKNILDKTKFYRNREALNLNTPNTRTTHRKYLEILLQYYGETGDDILYNKAEDLQSFIESINARKK